MSEATFTIDQQAMAESVAARVASALLSNPNFMDRVVSSLMLEARDDARKVLERKAGEIESRMEERLVADSDGILKRAAGRIEVAARSAEHNWRAKIELKANEITAGLSESSVRKTLAEMIQAKVGPKLGELTAAAIRKLGASLRGEGAPIYAQLARREVVDQGSAELWEQEKEAVHVALLGLLGPQATELTGDLAARIRIAFWVSRRLAGGHMSLDVARSYGVDPDALAAHDAAHRARQDLDDMRAKVADLEAKLAQGVGMPSVAQAIEAGVLLPVTPIAIEATAAIGQPAQVEHPAFDEIRRLLESLTPSHRWATAMAQIRQDLDDRRGDLREIWRLLGVNTITPRHTWAAALKQLAQDLGELRQDGLDRDDLITAAHAALDKMGVEASADLAARIRTADGMSDKTIARLQAERDDAWGRIGRGDASGQDGAKEIETLREKLAGAIRDRDAAFERINKLEAKLAKG